MRACIYCGSTNKTMGKEHIFPNFILKNIYKEQYYQANTHKKDFQSNIGHVTKKVCIECNNEPLSKIDGAASKVFSEHELFDTHISINDEIQLPKMFKKWVCKIAIASIFSEKLNVEHSTFMSDIFSEEVRKKIIDEESDIPELSVLVSFVDTRLYSIKDERPNLFFDVRISKSKEFYFVKVLIGQMAFIIYLTEQGYKEQFGGSFSKILEKNHKIKVDSYLGTKLFLQFLSKAAFETITINYIVNLYVLGEKLSNSDNNYDAAEMIDLFKRREDLKLDFDRYFTEEDKAVAYKKIKEMYS